MQFSKIQIITLFLMLDLRATDLPSILLSPYFQFAQIFLKESF